MLTVYGLRYLASLTRNFIKEENVKAINKCLCVMNIRVINLTCPRSSIGTHIFALNDEREIPKIGKQYYVLESPTKRVIKR